MNVLFIGKTYVRMKQNDKAKEVCAFDCNFAALHSRFDMAQSSTNTKPTDRNNETN